MARRKSARRSIIRPHRFIGDTTQVSWSGQADRCAICSMGRSNACHPKIPDVPAEAALIDARILGEPLEDE